MADLAIYGPGYYLGAVVILGSQSRGGWVLFPLIHLALLLLLPRACRNRCLYALMVNLGAALVISRRFLPAVLAGQQAYAVKLLLAGALAVIVVHAIVYSMSNYLAGRAEARVRRFLALGAMIYLGLAVAAYAYYAAQAFPQAAQGFVPGQVAARAGTISGYEPSFQRCLWKTRRKLKPAWSNRSTLPANACRYDVEHFA
ncbi:hypothetical protein MGLY_20210 [Neomoorella glycerini]|uniref:Uncharacterized protein n=2 Tax=Neomoorella glycerini TaxID=55779 RepID=A0A6I5ZRL2_9FIRM|nr:hypothetical protein MGLY_20210 [Moorella glycerini]